MFFNKTDICCQKSQAFPLGKILKNSFRQNNGGTSQFVCVVGVEKQNLGVVVVGSPQSPFIRGKTEKKPPKGLYHKINKPYIYIRNKSCETFSYL